MELFQKLKVTLNPEYPGFQKTLIELVDSSGDWHIRKDYQRTFMDKVFLKDRSVFCIETPKIDYKDKLLQAVIWIYDYGTYLESFNIVPSIGNRLNKSEYNYILNTFVNTFIKKTASDYHSIIQLSNPILEITDFVDKDVFDTLQWFSESANKMTGRSHPSDEKNWFNFIILSASKKDRLPVEYLIGWLIDNGWQSDIASELGLDYEYGLSLLDYEHHRR